ncbi:hypothetical protein BKA83DRAFT_4123628 [Pisolithus microcarpus]|nr:hypothetical protein BKA83DRAFT_4123628 [Pisolithus microcarpus]
MPLGQTGLEILQELTCQSGESPFSQGYPIVTINIGGVWGPSGTFSSLYRGLNCAILGLSPGQIDLSQECFWGFSIQGYFMGISQDEIDHCQDHFQGEFWGFSMVNRPFPRGVWNFPGCIPSEWQTLGNGESPIGQLEILHGCGDSPSATMGFPYDYYVAVENLQLGSWGFSMGVEISQVPQWDFSTPLMGRDGDSPIGQLDISMGVEFPQLPEWHFPMTIMWQWRISNWAVGDSPWVWRFPKCKNEISPRLLWGWGFSSWACLDSP